MAEIANWDALRKVGISPEDAKNQLGSLFAAGSLTIRGSDNRDVHLRVNSEMDADHFLYKPKKGGRDRGRRLCRHADDFIRARAERIGFLEPTLQDPDEIRQDTAFPQRRTYTRSISETELFVVIIAKPNRGASYLVTAFPVDLSVEWQKVNWEKGLDKSESLYKRRAAREQP